MKRTAPWLARCADKEKQKAGFFVETANNKMLASSFCGKGVADDGSEKSRPYRHCCPLD